LRRTVTLPFVLPAVLPETLPALIPDLVRNCSEARNVPDSTAALPKPERFLFFDLETTGLSGGAGTVAFLAAFGRFVPGTPQAAIASLEVTQFLLLDYPGESDFLERILSFISSPSPYFLTTYNGKAFDTQILKTRCLMNGLELPLFLQADLLHPARRLWKRMLPNCSQATIETEVLGLDRTGDTPGSMAPDIWFNFLRSGEEFTETEIGKKAEPSTAGVPEKTTASRALLGICDHNVRDIFGLASLFRSFTEIAAAPLEASSRFRCDEENLALHWRRQGKHEEEKTAALLLEAAAEKYPRSCLRLGFDLFRRGSHEEARTMLARLANVSDWKVPCTVTVQALALRSLAIDAQRRLGCVDLALSYIKKAVSLSSLPKRLNEDLEKRRNNLELIAK
jgi:uncharacterized protein YprB with RNaseH-like and TPR domain